MEFLAWSTLAYRKATFQEGQQLSMGGKHNQQPSKRARACSVSKVRSAVDSNGGQWQRAVASHLAPCARQVIPRSDKFLQPHALMALSRLQKLPNATKEQSVKRWQLASRSPSSSGQFSATAMTPTSVRVSQPDRSSSCTSFPAF